MVSLRFVRQAANACGSNWVQGVEIQQTPVSKGITESLGQPGKEEISEAAGDGGICRGCLCLDTTSEGSCLPKIYSPGGGTQRSRHL